MPRGKAVGLDGWTVEEMRLWPPLLFQWLADLFNAVEQGKPWPRALAAVEGLLLPKGDQADPTDRRPIWLLSLTDPLSDLGSGQGALSGTLALRLYAG